MSGPRERSRRFKEATLCGGPVCRKRGACVERGEPGLHFDILERRRAQQSRAVPRSARRSRAATRAAASSAESSGSPRSRAAASGGIARNIPGRFMSRERRPDRRRHLAVQSGVVRSYLERRRAKRFGARARTYRQSRAVMHTADQSRNSYSAPERQRVQQARAVGARAPLQSGAAHRAGEDISRAQLPSRRDESLHALRAEPLYAPLRT